MKSAIEHYNNQTSRNQMSEWKPISTAPKDKTFIIAYAKEHGGNVCLVSWSDTHEYWVDPYTASAFEWDYWTPFIIPPLPKDYQPSDEVTK